MKRMTLFTKDYFKLFAKREGRIVLGNRNANLWLLTIVLFVTFLAVAFSSGSLRYLSDKMNDPFINWVDIKNDYGRGGKFSELSMALEDDALSEQYHYTGYQSDYYFSWMFYGKEDDQVQYLRCRFFGDINSPLIEAILDKDNVVGECCVADLSEVDPNTVGVIVTEEMMGKLGYSAPYPAYIDRQRYNPEAEELGFHVMDGFVRLPLPVLGVVHRLPGNVDLISTKNCYFQDINDSTYPFSYSDNPAYAHILYYYVPDGLGSDAFMEKVEGLLEEAGLSGISMGDYHYWPEIVPYRPGAFVSIESDSDELPVETAAEISSMIDAAFAGDDIHRVFDFNFSEYSQTLQAYISVHFKDLDKVGDFQEFVKDQFDVNIEMTQINAKKNFNAVSIMANILSWAMILFAIACIILFIVNLLQSYFQKVKRNIGTFKAFGISNRELSSVYTLIVFCMVLAAVIIALAAVCLVQLLIPVMGLLKEGHNLLDLWNIQTFLTIVIILAASIVTVRWVIGKLLVNTPGDLIYDR